MKSLFALLFALALTSPTGAQVQPPTGMLLLPITKTNVPGANGSLWVTENYLHNHSDETLWVSNIWWCQLSAVHACDVDIPARSTMRWTSYPGSDPYEIWTVTEGDPQAFSASSFVRNISSETDPWGTAVPTPRANDFRSQPVHLSPIPGDPRYRVGLRVYGYSWPNHPTDLFVEIWTVNQQGARDSVATSFALGALPKEHSRIPASYFEVHDVFAAVPNRESTSRFSIRLTTPTNPGAYLWGFASIVHNETQHVTVFAP